MKVERLTELLGTLIQSAISGSRSNLPGLRPPAGLEWAALTETALQHGLGTLVRVGAEIEGWTPPHRPLADLDDYATAARIRNAGVMTQLEEIVGALNACGIRPVLLKGLACALFLYREPGHRTFADMDLLVPPELREAVDAALLARGYSLAEVCSGPRRAWYAEHHHHWIYYRGREVPLELHWALTPQASPVCLDGDALWARSRQVAVPGGTARVLCPEDGMLHLALHAATDEFRVPLRTYADLAAILHAAPEFRWACLWAAARASGGQRDLAVLLRTAQALKWTPLPAAVTTEAARALDAELPLEALAHYAVHGLRLSPPEALLRALARPDATVPSPAQPPQDDDGAPNEASLGDRAEAYTRKLRRAVEMARSLPELRTAATLRRLFEDRAAHRRQ